jgi:hypothetical protein
MSCIASSNACSAKHYKADYSIIKAFQQHYFQEMDQFSYRGTAIPHNNGYRGTATPHSNGSEPFHIFAQFVFKFFKT